MADVSTFGRFLSQGLNQTSDLIFILQDVVSLYK